MFSNLKMGLFLKALKLCDRKLGIEVVLYFTGSSVSISHPEERLKRPSVERELVNVPHKLAQSVRHSSELFYEGRSSNSSLFQSSRYKTEGLS